jgi:DNA-directed RNA polymerase subunit L
VIAADRTPVFARGLEKERYKRLTTPDTGMELRVTESTENELSIEIAGEDHTFMNVLKGALLEHDDVSAATYDVNPEQSGGQTEPILTIKTESGVAPLDALEEAAVDVREKTVAFREAFEAAA